MSFGAHAQVGPEVPQCPGHTHAVGADQEAQLLMSEGKGEEQMTVLRFSMLARQVGQYPEQSFFQSGDGGGFQLVS